MIRGNETRMLDDAEALDEGGSRPTTPLTWVVPAQNQKKIETERMNKREHWSHSREQLPYLSTSLLLLPVLAPIRGGGDNDTIIEQNQITILLVGVAATGR